MSQSILIIGGTRYFGFHIAERLVLAGHDVTLFSRGRSPLRPAGVRHIAGDRCDHAAFAATFRGRRYDAVIDMIAYDAADSLSVIEVFAGAVGHVIHISTASVYAVLEELPAPVYEVDYGGVVKRPERASRGYAYGMGKRGCEDALWEAHACSGLPVTTLRLPIVLGEGDYTLRAQSTFSRLLDGQPVVLPSGGLNPMSFVYQADVVEFVVANVGADRVKGQALNLAQDEIPTVRSFVEQSARLLDCSPELVDIPIDVLKRAGFDFAGSPFTSKRPFVVANARARGLGFQPTPMAVWLERTIRDAVQKGATPEEYAAHRQHELLLIDAWRSHAQSFEAEREPTG